MVQYQIKQICVLRKHANNKGDPMPPAVKFIIMALILYTTAIWGERYHRRLYLWMVATFAVGLVCDLTGTTMMALSAKSHTLHVHTVAGYSALLIMLIHLIWAVLALKNEIYQKLFTRFSVYAWAIWMIAFSTGAIFR